MGHVIEQSSVLRLLGTGSKPACDCAKPVLKKRESLERNDWRTTGYVLVDTGMVQRKSLMNALLEYPLKAAPPYMLRNVCHVWLYRSKAMRCCILVQVLSSEQSVLTSRNDHTAYNLVHVTAKYMPETAAPREATNVAILGVWDAYCYVLISRDAFTIGCKDLRTPRVLPTRQDCEIVRYGSSRTAFRGGSK
jgi:hypothetical protein